MSQINSNIKDDFQVVLLLSCFVEHPVGRTFFEKRIARQRRLILFLLQGAAEGEPAAS